MKKKWNLGAMILMLFLCAGLTLPAFSVNAAPVQEESAAAESADAKKTEEAAQPVQTGKTGWLKQGSDKYYLVNGKKVTGWKKINGAKYYFKKNGKMVKKTTKINGRLEVFHTNGKWINTAAMDKKAAKLKSRTKYLILVNLNKKVTKIYKGKKGKWKPVKNILCTIGNPKKGWDTVKGTFYVGYSSWGNPTTRGYSFEDAEHHTLYYWTRFCDSFLFHSQLYNLNTTTLTKEENGLGKALSHGCVRMAIGNAKWIWQNVPDGSKVVVY